MSDGVDQDMKAAVDHSEGDPAFFTVVEAGIIQIVKVERPQSFSRRIDKGEREVLSLSLQKKADFVILDDRKAFNEARELHLAVISTRTVLTFAEERHLIQNYRKIEEELRANKFHPPKY